MSTAVAPEGQLPAPETCAYKEVAGLRILADVRGAEPGARKPAVLWVHGGALILGARYLSRAPFQARLLASGYVLVSIDYRLAPETKLPGIVEDLEDAYRWLREEVPARFGIDPDRIAIAGGSAGGYL